MCSSVMDSTLIFTICISCNYMTSNGPKLLFGVTICGGSPLNTKKNIKILTDDSHVMFCEC